MAKNPFSIKISDIKYNYGIKAAEYFKTKPYCENCPEERLATLSIHHTHGKNINKFRVLCHNCHALTHATKTGHTTYRQLIKEKEIKSSKEVKVFKKIKYLLDKGYSLRYIGRLLGISHNTVRNKYKKYEDRSF